MGERELREKYGGKLPKAMNRAIRAEVQGGNEALDALTVLAGAARRSGWMDKTGRETPEAVAYQRHQRDVIAKMQAQVRKTWGIQADAKDKKPPRLGKPKRKPGSRGPQGTGAARPQKRSNPGGQKRRQAGPGAGRPKS